MNILFICTGNVNRSPAAQIILENMSNEDKSILVDSAAISDYQKGNKMIKRMTDTLREYGYKIDNIPISKPITQELVDWADMILCMQPHHLISILDKFGEKYRNKTRPLSNFSSKNIRGINDPHGKFQKVYYETIDQLEDCCEKLYENLSSRPKE